MNAEYGITYQCMLITYQYVGFFQKNGNDQIVKRCKEIGIRLRGNKGAGNNRCYVPYKFGKQILIVQAFEGSFLNIYFPYGKAVTTEQCYI